MRHSLALMRSCALVLLPTALAVLPPRARCQQENHPDIVVLLDRATFDPATYEGMQSTANDVAKIVNTLIPGVPADYKQSNVLCYIGKISSPQTTVGPEPPAGYPSYLPIKQIRIGLTAGPGNKPMLAYQLAHELTHVKMGAKNDNYMVELFVVAVQLEVLRRLGLTDQLALEFRDAKVGLGLEWPPEVYTALLWRDDIALARYWQDQEIRQQRLNQTDWDYGLLAVGSLVLASHGQLEWSKLLDIGDLSSSCRPMKEGLWTQVCQPDMARLLVREPVLKWLGYR